MVFHYEVVFSSSFTCFFFTFPPHKVVFHYEVRRLETPSWSCPRAGRARTLCSSSWVSLFPPFRVFSCVCVLDLPEPEGHLLNGSSLDQSGKRPGNPGVPAAGRSAGKLQLFTECFPEICHWEPFLFHSNASCIWKFSPPFKCLLNRCCIEWVSG